MKKLALYNHGKDSQPWGEKTLALTEIAKKHGYLIDSIDYRDQLNPDDRVQRLLAYKLSEYDEIVLIGSSMGAYVATVAAPVIKPKGLFLLAPAFYLPSYQQSVFNPPAAVTEVIHGWQDDIVPPENAWKFCKEHRIALIMLDADHRLMSHLTTVTEAFDRFLSKLN